MRNSTSPLAWSLASIVAASLALLGAGCQSSSPSSSSSTAPAAAAPAMATPAASSSAMLPVPVRIAAGTTNTIKDDAGNTWIGYGNFFADGETIDRPGIPIANAGAKEADLYRSERYSMTKFSYGPIANGDYTVKLHFCETYDGITGAGQRVFNFNVNGTAFNNFDIWVKAPGFEHAYIETVPVTVKDQHVTVTFSANVENPQINGIEILPGH